MESFPLKFDTSINDSLAQLQLRRARLTEEHPHEKGEKESRSRIQGQNGVSALLRDEH